MLLESGISMVSKGDRRQVLSSCSLTVVYLLLVRGKAGLTVTDSGVSTGSKRASLS